MGRAARLGLDWRVGMLALSDAIPDSYSEVSGYTYAQLIEATELVEAVTEIRAIREDRESVRRG